MHAHLALAPQRQSHLLQVEMAPVVLPVRASLHYRSFQLSTHKQTCPKRAAQLASSSYKVRWVPDCPERSHCFPRPALATERLHSHCSLPEAPTRVLSASRSHSRGSSTALLIPHSAVPLPQQVTIKSSQSEESFQCPGDSYILDAALDNGVELPFECSAGEPQAAPSARPALQHCSCLRAWRLFLSSRPPASFLPEPFAHCRGLFCVRWARGGGRAGSERPTHPQRGPGTFAACTVRCSCSR